MRTVTHVPASASIALLLAITSGFLVACGNSETSEDKPSPAGPTTVDAANVSPSGLAPEPKIKGAQGARADVTLDGCPVKGKRATATGSLENSTDEATDYAITVSWVNQRSDVRARGVSVLQNVEPGEKRTWETSAPAGSGIATCTLLAQRGVVADAGTR